MQVFLAWRSVILQRNLDLAILENDSEKVRRIGQSADKANEIMRSWLEAHDGSPLLMGPTEGQAMVQAEHLSGLPDIIEQLKGTVDAPIVMGVGAKLLEARKALDGRSKGGSNGNPISLYTQEMENEESEESSESSDGTGFLSKAEVGPEILDQEDMSSPALNSGTGNAGMSGAKHPSPPAKPQGDASSHSQGEEMKNVMDEDNPPPPEITHASELEDHLHQLAEKQGNDDKAGDDAAKEKQSQTDGIKQQVMEILEQIKKQAPILEQLKQQAPPVYKTIMGMVKAVIAMARQLSGGEEEKPQEEVQKSEKDVLEPLQKMAIKSIPPGRPIDREAYKALPSSMQETLSRQSKHHK